MLFYVAKICQNVTRIREQQTGENIAKILISSHEL